MIKLISFELSVIAIACVTSIACTLPGVFLVLRGTAMLSDAISHAMLPGVVISFLFTSSVHSPLLFVGGCLAGILTALICEWTSRARIMSHDSALGLTFPMLFSIGILLICLYARNAHLDADMVLLGEIGLSPLQRLSMYGYDLGPSSLWSMTSLCIIEWYILQLFFHPLIYSLFDPFFAQRLGLHYSLQQYLIIVLVSICTVASFDIVGSLVVVALTVIPAATARLFSTTVTQMICYSVIIALQSSICGYAFARYFDVSISGSISLVNALFFLLAFFVHTCTNTTKNQSML